MNELADALMKADQRWLILAAELEELTRNDPDAQTLAVELLKLILNSDSFTEEEIADNLEAVSEAYIKSLKLKLKALNKDTQSETARKLFYDIRDKALELANRTTWIMTTFGDAYTEKMTDYFTTQLERRFNDRNVDKMIDRKLASKPLPIHLKLLEATGLNRQIRKSDLERFLKNNGHEVTKQNE